MENKEYTPGQNRPGRRGGMRGPGMGRGPVSYTHLTLPTKLEV